MEKGVNVPLLRTWRLAASLVTAVYVTAALLTAEYVVMPLYAWWSVLLPRIVQRIVPLARLPAPLGYTGRRIGQRNRPQLSAGQLPCCLLCQLHLDCNSARILAAPCRL